MIEQKSSILSEKNVAGVLLFLLDGCKKENDFTKIISNYYSINATLTKLCDAGLVSMTVEKSRYTIRWYELTQLGYQVAQDLKKATDRIDGILPEEPLTNCGAPSQEGDTINTQ